jgi:hypothetical protein
LCRLRCPAESHMRTHVHKGRTLSYTLRGVADKGCPSTVASVSVMRTSRTAAFMSARGRHTLPPAVCHLRSMIASMWTFTCK